MTLIIGASKPGAAIMLADTLLSYDPRISSNSELPSQFLRGSAIGEKGVAGLTQKITFLSPRLAIGWAGTMQKAQAVIRKLAAALDGQNSLTSLQKVIDADLELNALLPEVSLVLLRLDATLADGKLQAQAAGIGALRIESQRHLFAAGSGAYHFFELVSERQLLPGGGGQGPGKMLADELALLGGRFASIVLREAFDETPLNFGYGGAFEVVIAESGRLAKLPYTLVYWLRDNQRLILRGPIIKVDYSDAGEMIVQRFPLAATETHAHATFNITPSLPEFARHHFSAKRPSAYFHAIVGRNDLIVLTQLAGEHDFQAVLDPRSRQLSLAVSADFQDYIRQVTGTAQLQVAGKREAAD